MTRRKLQGVKKVSKQSPPSDVALASLTEKMYRWLMQQPEWVHVLSADRATRKRYGVAIANAVTRIPAYVSDPPREVTSGAVLLELPKGENDVEATRAATEAEAEAGSVGPGEAGVDERAVSEERGARGLA